MTKRLPALIGLTTCLLITGCGASGDDKSPPGAMDSAPTAVTVDITEFKYDKPALTVTAGTRVTWVNEDNAPHTATVKGGFDTGSLNKGDKKTLVLDEPGTYAYICAFHPFMKGTVTVK